MTPHLSVTHLTKTHTFGTLRRMQIKSHKDLRVWREAHSLTLKVYEVTKIFPLEERFGITSQLRRAAASVGANIVEGFSRRGPREFAKFLSIARASAKETEYFLQLAKELRFVEADKLDALIIRYSGLSAGIFLLANKLDLAREHRKLPDSVTP
ncbi:MAG: four helix bundle protein [Patescibacteria group bacterium]|jgi:four helix bundle protein